MLKRQLYSVLDDGAVRCGAVRVRASSLRGGAVVGQTFRPAQGSTLHILRLYLKRALEAFISLKITPCFGLPRVTQSLNISLAMSCEPFTYSFQPGTLVWCVPVTTVWGIEHEVALFKHRVTSLYKLVTASI